MNQPARDDGSLLADLIRLQRDVTLALAASRSFEEAIASVLPVLGGGLAWEWAVYWHWDQEAHALCRHSVWQPEGRAGPPSDGVGLQERAWQTGQTVVASGGMAVPVRGRDEHHGVLELGGDRTLEPQLVQSLDTIGIQMGQFLELKTAELALKESERRFRTVIERSPFSMQIFAPDGQHRLANAAWEAVWQSKREDALNYNVLHDPQVAALGILPHLEQGFAGVASDIPMVCYDPRQIGKQGRPRWTQGFVYPLLDDLGQVQEVVLAHRDVTELQEAIRIRDAFLSIASHELRTPLTPLLLGLQHLVRCLDQADAQPLDAHWLRERVGYLETQVQRMVMLINHLLDVSRMAEGALKLEPETLDAAVLVREVVARLEIDWVRSGSELRVHIPPSVMGQWDPLRLDQVVTNLLSNAIKYGKGQPIDVTLSEEAAGICLTITDRGIGMAPGEQERLFQRYERLVSERHFGGFGLGLWIVRQIVDAMGGSIEVTSDLGQGSTFRVKLPRRPATSPQS